MTEQIKLPNVDGEEVQIIEICVKIGDFINEDEPLIVVETQKASMDIPAPFSGVIKSINVQEGDKIKEGDLICEISKEAEKTKEKTDKENEKAKPLAKSEISENCVIIDNKKICKVIEDVFLQDLDKADKFEVIEVLVSVNDSVDFKNNLLILQGKTSKINIPSPYGGVIKELNIKQGDKVDSTTLIGKIEKEVVEFIEIKKEKSTPEENLTPKVEPSFINEGKIYASPSIRRLAKKYGVSLSLVKGSGRKGRISKEDVRIFIKESLSSDLKQSPAQNNLNFNLPPSKEVDFSKFGEIETMPLSKIQKISGPSLHKNYLSMPHITQFDECDITELESFRKAQNAINLKKQNGIKLSPLVFVLKAVAKTLQIYPKFNTSLVAESLVYKKYIHIGVAVDTKDGLVVPVIKDVDKKGLNTLANELKEISQKAREGKLKLQDMQGGCFTISSLGGIGGTYFTPIINAPEVAILGLSKSQMKPTWNGESFKPRLILPLSLSYDHKVIDGADGARFTSTLSELLSDIKMLLL